MSLGTWILKIAGKIKTSLYPKVNPGRIYIFNNLCDKLHKSKYLDAEDLALYRQMKTMLRNYTICQANAIIITMSNSKDTPLYTLFQPQLVVVNKASRATEQDMWNI